MIGEGAALTEVGVRRVKIRARARNRAQTAGVLVVFCMSIIVVCCSFFSRWKKKGRMYLNLGVR